MNIALPILLLVFGALTFWLLTESALKWYFKTVCITAFCVFTIVFWTSIHTFLGWGANENDLPEKILIHWVIIKEPNKLTKREGSIYILAESANKSNKGNIVDFFGYKNNLIEPRLYKIKYNRKLHEQLNKISQKLKKGQPVFGKLNKTKGEQKNGTGKGKAPSDKKGEGSESQNQEWEFHELLPSDIHEKPNE